MSLYTTTSQLLQLMQEECNDISPSTATRSRYLALLNQAHLEIVNGGGVLNESRSGDQKSDPYDFTFIGYDNEAFIQLYPASEGNVTVTQDSTSASFASAPSTSQAGKTIIIDDVTYTIAAHTAAATAFTLNSICLSDSDTYPAKWFTAEYEITGNAWRLSTKAHYQSPNFDDEISVVSFERFRAMRKNRDWTFGRPTLIGLKKSSGSTITLILDSVPTVRSRISVFYATAPSTLDLVSVNPILPEINRKMIVHLAAYYQFIKRDETRAQSQLAIARSMFLSMVSGDTSQKRAEAGVKQTASIRLFRPAIARRNGRFRLY